jgi:hypothetical protein
MIVLAAVLLVGAVFVYRWLSSEEAPSGGEAVKMYCTSCKQPFEYSQREFANIMDKREYKFSGDVGSGAGKPDATAEKGMFFKCPKCKQMTALSGDPPPADGGK